MMALVWFVGVLGCFNGPRKDKSYTYLPEPSGISHGTKLRRTFSLKFSTSEVKTKFCLFCFSMFRTLIQKKGIFETCNCTK